MPACPSARARPLARPSVPRPSLPPQLALPGRAPAAGAATAAAPGARSAAGRPGTRRGAGAAPNWPRVSPSPVLGIQESLSLCSPRGVLPRRGESRWGAGRGRPRRNALEGGEPGFRGPDCTTRPGGLGARARIMCYLSRGGAERCQAPGSRRLAGLEDWGLMAAQSGQAGACWRTASGKGAGDPRPSFGLAGPTPAAASSPVSP